MARTGVRAGPTGRGGAHGQGIPPPPAPDRPIVTQADLGEPIGRTSTVDRPWLGRSGTGHSASGRSLSPVLLLTAVQHKRCRSCCSPTGRWAGSRSCRAQRPRPDGQTAWNVHGHCERPTPMCSERPPCHATQGSRPRTAAVVGKECAHGPDPPAHVADDNRRSATGPAVKRADGGARASTLGRSPGDIAHGKAASRRLWSASRSPGWRRSVRDAEFVGTVARPDRAEPWLLRGSHWAVGLGARRPTVPACRCCLRSTPLRVELMGYLNGRIQRRRCTRA